MKCKNCGAELKEGETVCRSCGSDQTPEEEIDTAEVRQDVTFPAKKRRTQKLAILGLSLVAIGLMIAIAAVLASRGGTAAPAEEPAQNTEAAEQAEETPAEEPEETSDNSRVSILPDGSRNEIPEEYLPRVEASALSHWAYLASFDCIKMAVGGEHSLNLFNDYLYYSYDPEIATVDPIGNVAGVGPGTTYIVAAHEPGEDEMDDIRSIYVFEVYVGGIVWEGSTSISSDNANEDTETTVSFSIVQPVSNIIVIHCTCTGGDVSLGKYSETAYEPTVTLNYFKGKTEQVPIYWGSECYDGSDRDHTVINLREEVEEDLYVIADNIDELDSLSINGIYFNLSNLPDMVTIELYNY